VVRESGAVQGEGRRRSPRPDPAALRRVSRAGGRRRGRDLIVEITGAPDKIDGLEKVLEPFGILEMVRTGAVAMTRGAELRLVQAA
jgi:hypothetical protein